MKLNGWKRIGVVASVAWVVVAGAWTYGAKSQSDMNNVQFMEKTECETLSTSELIMECDRGWDNYLAKEYKYEWVDAVIVATVPVPIGWGFIYLALFTISWIRRGFVRPVL